MKNKEQKNENNTIPGLRLLTADFESTNNWINQLFAVSVIICLLLMTIVFLHPVPYLKIFGIIGVLLAIIVFFYDYIGIFKLGKRRLDKLTEDKIGNHSVEDLKKMLEETLTMKHRKEIPTIYIIEEDISPFVIDISLFNFIKPINAIYLPRYLFGILNREELKGIIAHEVAHFYRYIYSFQRFILPLNIIACILPVFLFPFINPRLFGVGYVVFIYLLHFVQNKIYVIKSKTLEYLCDLYAVSQTSRIDVINALLVIGKYSEMQERLFALLLKEIKSRDDFSLEHFDKFNDYITKKIESENIRDEKDLTEIVRQCFESKKFEEFKTHLPKYRREQEEKAINDMVEGMDLKEKSTLDWSKFDFVVRNFKIESDEYDALIETLKSEPDKPLLNSVIDSDNDAINPSHPSLRKRILSIDKNGGV